MTMTMTMVISTKLVVVFLQVHGSNWIAINEHDIDNDDNRCDNFILTMKIMTIIIMKIMTISLLRRLLSDAALTTHFQSNLANTYLILKCSFHKHNQHLAIINVSSKQPIIEQKQPIVFIHHSSVTSPNLPSHTWCLRWTSLVFVPHICEAFIIVIDKLASGKVVIEEKNSFLFHRICLLAKR